MRPGCRSTGRRPRRGRGGVRYASSVGATAHRRRRNAASPLACVPASGGDVRTEENGNVDKRDLIDKCREHNVRFIRLQFSELHGQLKNVSIPVEELEKALDNELMFDGSSIRGFKRIEQSDMYFLPDPATYALLPWRGNGDRNTARLICDVADPDGQPFAGDPRSNLKRVLKQAQDMGYTMQVGPEAEFFLFRLDGDGNPTVDPHDAATYFDVAPSTAVR